MRLLVYELDKLRWVKMIKVGIIQEWICYKRIIKQVENKRINNNSLLKLFSLQMDVRIQNVYRIQKESKYLFNTYLCYNSLFTNVRD